MSENTATNRPASLNILPDQDHLRDDSTMLRRMPWPRQEQLDPPRALRGLARIIDGGLCHRCGSCVGICPTNVLSLDKLDYPKIKNLSACTDCDLCVKVCPGDEFDYQRHHQERFGQSGQLESTHGHFIDAVIAHTNLDNLRQKATSGGLVTALLLHLLESKQIDGAIVIAADQENLWKGKPIVARSAEEMV
ncbi:MAG: 4Fe-4S binding protein, partial [Bdellovibrionales bacterium]|nr:4Fe-4S binding protein [Bdellovibrionales bacterium]